MSKTFTICYGTPEQVTNEVNILLDDGWVISGNLAVTCTSSGASRAYQAMVLPKDSKKPEVK